MADPDGTIRAFFDGLCEAAYPGGPRNPGGLGCGGWVVELPSGTVTGHRSYGSGKGVTNNVGGGL